MKVRFAMTLLLCATSTAAIAEPKGLVASYLCASRLQSKGCDTSYEEGVSSVRVNETTAHITARGNSRTTSEAVFQYVMRKSAETTIAAGYDLFQIIAQADATQHLSGVDGGEPNGNGGYFPVYSYNITKPGQVLTIKFFRGPKAIDAPGNVFDAREVLKFMQPPGAQ